MEEYQSILDTNVEEKDVMIKIKDGAYSWGFRVSDD